MAFKDLPRPERGFGSDTFKNTVACYVQDNGTVVFRLSSDIHAKMGSPSFCRVMVGTGEHFGRIAVLPSGMKTDDTRKFTYQPNGKSPTFTVGAKRIGVSKGARKTVHLPHEITEDGLIIDIRPLMKPVAVQTAA